MLMKPEIIAELTLQATSYDNGDHVPTLDGADTWYDEGNRMKITAEMLAVQDRLNRGEIDEEEATTLLDMLASQQD